MFKGKRFTPAMIVAMIALAVALSGTAVAGTAKLITGSQIANGTIKLVDIHSSAKTALKGKTGATGPQGACRRPGCSGPDRAAGRHRRDKGDTGAKGDEGSRARRATRERRAARANDADEEYGVASSAFSAATSAQTAWATYSTELGSPVGDTTAALPLHVHRSEEPCKPSVVAKVLSDTSVASGKATRGCGSSAVATPTAP